MKSCPIWISVDFFVISAVYFYALTTLSQIYVDYNIPLSLNQKDRLDNFKMTYKAWWYYV